MRRWIVYVLVVAAVLMLRPKDIKDAVGLIPVELVYISKQAGKIKAETDTGNIGVGKDLDSALQNLKDTAAGEIFLETADYLIVTDRTIHLLPDLAEVLRPAAEVCVGINTDVKAAEYLKAHRTGVTLKDIRAGTLEVPTLIRNGGRYQFGQWRKLRTQA